MSETITLQQILEEIKTNRNEIINKIEATEVRLLMNVETINERVKELEKENKTLREEIESLKQENNKNSIVVFGLSIPKEDLKVEYICQQLNTLVEVQVDPSDIDNFYKLGKSLESPIKIQFVSYLKKQEILKNCFKLKGKNISIASNQTFQQRQEWKILRHHLHLAKEAKKDCYIKGYKLYVNGKHFTAADLTQEVELQEERRTNSAPSTPTPNQNQEENQEFVPIVVTPRAILKTTNILTPQKETDIKKRTTRQNPQIPSKKFKP